MWPSMSSTVGRTVSPVFSVASPPVAPLPGKCPAEVPSGGKQHSTITDRLAAHARRAAQARELCADPADTVRGGGDKGRRASDPGVRAHRMPSNLPASSHTQATAVSVSLGRAVIICLSWGASVDGPGSRGSSTAAARPAVEGGARPPATAPRRHPRTPPARCSRRLRQLRRAPHTLCPACVRLSPPRFRLP
jgi:hypothetical protein